MSTIVECKQCKNDFDADRSAVCVWCGSPSDEARAEFLARIRYRLESLCEDAADGGLTKLDVEHLLVDVWPAPQSGTGK